MCDGFPLAPVALPPSFSAIILVSRFIPLNRSFASLESTLLVSKPLFSCDNDI